MAGREIEGTRSELKSIRIEYGQLKQYVAECQRELAAIQIDIDLLANKKARREQQLFIWFWQSTTDQIAAQIDDCYRRAEQIRAELNSATRDFYFRLAKKVGTKSFKVGSLAVGSIIKAKIRQLKEGKDIALGMMRGDIDAIHGFARMGAQVALSHTFLEEIEQLVELMEAAKGE